MVAATCGKGGPVAQVQISGRMRCPNTSSGTALAGRGRAGVVGSLPLVGGEYGTIAGAYGRRNLPASGGQRLRGHRA